MLIAELKGKLPAGIENKEDNLTSNVFSFFKYSSRDIFLKKYLQQLGLSLSSQEVKLSEFKFWPRFSDNTEPDLVVIVGIYYILFEAKYFSDFSKATKKTKPQIHREIEGGIFEARNLGKQFYYVPITADSCNKKIKSKDIPKFQGSLVWTNWQNVSKLLLEILKYEPHLRVEDKSFATDLYQLLDKKRLRSFQGIKYNGTKIRPLVMEYVFLDAKATEFRGDFIGFIKTLSDNKMLRTFRGNIFLRPETTFFKLLDTHKIERISRKIFWRV